MNPTLILGGTGEARALAQELDEAGLPFVSSLAGRVGRPRLPVGEVRIGGFGGVHGLRRFLAERGVGAVVDATHPFAATISAHAAEACAGAEVPLLRLVRPGWDGLPGARRWHWVDGHPQAAALAARLGRRVLLTTGRQRLDCFVGPLASYDVLVRVVDPPDLALPPAWRIVQDRGPYTLAGERALMAGHRTEVLVTKDSGGDLTRAKLDAADAHGVEVVVVRRPAEPAGADRVSDVPGALRWLPRR
jgi:precorrin-6A/cobalt-precorrin-6A reductase